MIFFVYLETRSTGENKFDFLIKSMNQLSRNVRLCQKNETFLSISRDATPVETEANICDFQESFPRKPTINYYCTIR